MIKYLSCSFSSWPQAGSGRAWWPTPVAHNVHILCHPLQLLILPNYIHSVWNRKYSSPKKILAPKFFCTNNILPDIICYIYLVKKRKRTLLFYRGESLVRRSGIMPDVFLSASRSQHCSILYLSSFTFHHCSLSRLYIFLADNLYFQFS